VRIKQRAVIEFFPAEGVSPIEVHCRMQVVYGDDCPWNIITKVHQPGGGGGPKTQAWAGKATAAAFF
jgi:hypothetical protein